MTTTAVEPEATGRARMDGRTLAAVCLGLAALTLPVPAALSFDPWAWLVWGREVGALALDTTGGPSWKPLPVLVTTLLAPLGGAAVPLFTVVMRAGALLAVAATYRVAARFAGPAAGVVAAGLLLLAPDGDPRFIRLVAEGHAAPLSVAFALLAFEAHLDARRGRALALLWGFALSRPEAWPFLGLYAAWLWWRGGVRRGVVAATLVSVAVLWFGGDWWGSGDPLHGSDAAQVSAGIAAPERLVDAIGVAAALVVLPAWAFAASALRSARRRGEEALVVLAGAAALWAVVVIAMAATLGYAALSRFFLASAGAVCVLAGIGVVRAARAVGRAGPNRAVVAGLVVAVSLGATLPRITGVPALLEEARDRAALEDDLDLVIEQAGGPDTVTSCGEVAVAGVGLLRTAAAWKLELPMHRVGEQLADGSGVLLLPADGKRAATLRRSPVAEEVATTQRWAAFAVRCPSALPDS